MRMVQTYTLGKLDGIQWVNGRESDRTEGTRLLKALIAGTAARQNTATPDAMGKCDHKIITGFFLTLKDQRLKLSIFAKKGDSRRERHSAILSELTQMRQRRLN